MNKNVLVEQINSNFQVLPNKPANVLKRIKGIVSDNKSNRNGRVYPMSLWQNVVNSDYVKEMINNHSLFGEADHPETRLEISLQNVSHAINDLWIEGDKVLAVIDILPTPMGKIISELLDYGTNIGISSRGAGTVLRDNSVDPDDYQFVTFDFVARPSCEAARLNMILESASIEAQNTKDDEINNLLESYKSGLNESIKLTPAEEEALEYVLDACGDANDFEGMAQSELLRYKEENNVDINISNVIQAMVDTIGYGSGEEDFEDDEEFFEGVNLKEEQEYNIKFANHFSDSVICTWKATSPEKAVEEFLEINPKYKNKGKIVAEPKKPLTEGRVLDIVEARKLLSDTDAEGLDMVLDDLHGKVDLEKDSLVTIEDLVHDSVYKYNEANSLPDYENEEFYGKEYSARNIYRVILKMYGRDNMNESDLLESIRDEYINDTVKELLS